LRGSTSTGHGVEITWHSRSRTLFVRLGHETTTLLDLTVTTRKRVRKGGHSSTRRRPACTSLTRRRRRWWLIGWFRCRWSIGSKGVARCTTASSTTTRHGIKVAGHSRSRTLFVRFGHETTTLLHLAVAARQGVCKGRHASTRRRSGLIGCWSGCIISWFGCRRRWLIGGFGSRIALRRSTTTTRHGIKVAGHS